MQTEQFSHEGKDYEVRVISDGQSVYVKVFSSGKPVNGYRYEATLETVHDAATVTGLDAVKHLIELAKADVVGR